MWLGFTLKLFHVLRCEHIIRLAPPDNRIEMERKKKYFSLNSSLILIVALLCFASSWDESVSTIPRWYDSNRPANLFVLLSSVFVALAAVKWFDVYVLIIVATRFTLILLSDTDSDNWNGKLCRTDLQSPQSPHSMSFTVRRWATCEKHVNSVVIVIIRSGYYLCSKIAKITPTDSTANFNANGANAPVCPWTACCDNVRIQLTTKMKFIIFVLAVTAVAPVNSFRQLRVRFFSISLFPFSDILHHRLEGSGWCYSIHHWLSQRKSCSR